MTKYKVLGQQYVEETCVIEVEADSPEEAVQKVRDDTMAFVTAVWQPGDDAYEADIYAVMEGDDMVWERE
jgi:hypothetical protein